MDFELLDLLDKERREKSSQRLKVVPLSQLISEIIREHYFER